MPPQLALLGCWVVIAWLLWQDMKWRKAGSSALLIPAAWIAIHGSRAVSYWFGATEGESDLEGNPINTYTFAFLIGASVVILQKRNFSWVGFFQANKALVLVYGYLAVGSCWSELPMVSLKRLLKDFGSVLAVLVFLTEKDPSTAIRVVFVRVAYLLLPLSLVFGKYFPQIGRNYSHDGEPMFTGITTQKNALGAIIFVFGLMLAWDWLEIRKEGGPGSKLRGWVRLGMFLLGLWLLVICDSQTARLCLILGGAVVWVSGRLLRMNNGKTLLIAGLIGVVSLAALDKSVGLSEMILRAMNRNPSLTGRTDIWRVVLEQNTDPLLGSGFGVFWDTDKGKSVVEALAHIQSTHNGYLEMYVDGGLMGVVALGLFLLAGGYRVIERLFAGWPRGQLNLAFWFCSIVYNWSESSFLRRDMIWFSLLLATVVPGLLWNERPQTAEAELGEPLAKPAGLRPF